VPLINAPHALKNTDFPFAFAYWANDNSLYVGRSGSGTLTISKGGAVSNTWGHIGNDAGSMGEAAVSGAGSTWANSQTLSIGYRGIGTLTISDGGTVSNAGGSIGMFSNSTGEVTVSGKGSTWTNSGSLEVGRSGSGTLTISDGGMVSVTSVTVSAANIGSNRRGVINIGAAQGSAVTAPGTLNTSTVNLGATGSLIFNHTDMSGDHRFAPQITGTGTVTQIAGMTTFIANNTYKGTTMVAGGTLFINGDQSQATGAVTVASGAMLGGSGIIGGDVSVADGGILAPSGLLTINSQVDIAGTLSLNLYGSGLADMLAISSLNSVNISSATLDLILRDGVMPVEGTYYKLINYGPTAYDDGRIGSADGWFGSITSSPGYSYDIIYNYQESIRGSDDYYIAISFTVVPEPASLTLLALGAAGLLARRR